MAIDVLLTPKIAVMVRLTGLEGPTTFILILVPRGGDLESVDLGSDLLPTGQGPPPENLSFRRLKHYLSF